MFLDKVDETRGAGTMINSPQNKETKNSGGVYEKWKEMTASEISHHGKLCCEIAREWVTAMDYSELGSASVYTGPRWLRQKFNWGASDFPIYWCEAVRKKTLDCGAHAALAHEVFSARGVKSYRVQMVQRFSEVSTKQWAHGWNRENRKFEDLHWTSDDLIYHEGCAVIAPNDGELKMWDASAGWWVDPNSKDGYGALLAVRLSRIDLSPQTIFKWGKHTIKAWQWTQIN